MDSDGALHQNLKHLTGRVNYIAVKKMML